MYVVYYVQTSGNMNIESPDGCRTCLPKLLLGSLGHLQRLCYKFTQMSAKLFTAVRCIILITKLNFLKLHNYVEEVKILQYLVN